MKTIIVEDDAPVLVAFLNLIKKFCPELEILGAATNITEAKQLIEEQSPELLFLDVEMPGGTGFELLKEIPEINFNVIFTTAHEKYALQAIKYSALDFLLKPIVPQDLIQAIEKAKIEFEKKANDLKIKALLHNMEEQNTKSKQIIVKDKYGFHVVNIKEIIRLEAENNYTKFILSDRDSFLTSKTLKEYENMLSKQNFFRSHQSHLVNLDYLTRYDKQKDDKLILKDGSEVPISARKKEVLLDKLQNS